MHAKDEYNHAKSFFKMLSKRGKKASIKKARDFRFIPLSLIKKGYISPKGFLIETMKLKDFIAFVYTNELLAKSSFPLSKFLIKLQEGQTFLTNLWATTPIVDAPIK